MNKAIALLSGTAIALLWTPIASAQSLVDSLLQRVDSLERELATARFETQVYGKLYVHEVYNTQRRNKPWAVGTLLSSNFTAFGVVVTRNLPDKYKVPVRLGVAYVHETDEADNDKWLFGVLVPF